MTKLKYKFTNDTLFKILFVKYPDLLKRLVANILISLFNAKTEEELKQTEALGVPIMSEAIVAYRSVTADEKFKELERLRSRARHNEASALGHARREGFREADEKWQGVVAEKDAQIAKLLAQLAEAK